MLLDTGRDAANYSERWETALALNAEVMKATQAHGADALEVACARFSDCGPLLRLRRYGDARALLIDCRAVFEAERDIEMLGKVYSALADLENETGGRAAAVRFTEVALGYSYQAGKPRDCAISHHNLAIYLGHQGADPAAVLAHHLAAATIRLQMQSGELPITVHNLAISDLPPAPPSFADVVKRVEAVEGVRFQALFEWLPRTVSGGDAAIAAVWQRVPEEKRRRDERKQRQDVVLALAPAAIRAAFELEGYELEAALLTALAELPEVEDATLKQRLREAGLIEGPDVTRVLQRFEPLLQGIAAAVNDEGLRAQIEPELADLKQMGWRLTKAVHRIWAGEQDAEALTAGIDQNSAELVRRVLELLEQ